MNIGKAIRELRKDLKISQDELAKAADITQAALSGIENGKRPGKNTLTKISAALKVPESMIYMLGMEKDEVPAEKRLLYDELYPVIKGMIMKIASVETEKKE